MDNSQTSKGITISFEFSAETEKEFNDKLLELLSTEGVLYEIHQSKTESSIIQSNNKNIRTIPKKKRIS